MTGDKFLPELHLKQPGFTYCACGPFTKHRQRIQKFRETGHSKHLYRNELGQPCLTHNAGYSDSKDLAKRTVANKILKDRAYEISRNRKYDGYQRTLASIPHKFFDQKTRSGVSVNEELAEELHKPVIKKFKRRKGYSKFKDNLSAADLAAMGLLSSKNKNVKYLLCVIDIFPKYSWVKPLEYKIGKTVLNAFIEIVNEANCKSNKL